MADRSFLEWPFLEDQHRVLAAELDAWCVANLPVDHNNCLLYTSDAADD